jgi:hypothetical protein
MTRGPTAKTRTEWSTAGKNIAQLRPMSHPGPPLILSHIKGQRPLPKPPSLSPLSTPAAAPSVLSTVPPPPRSPSQPHPPSPLPVRTTLWHGRPVASATMGARWSYHEAKRALPHVVAAAGSRFLSTISGHGAAGSSTMARDGPLPQVRMEGSTSVRCVAARGSDGTPPSTPTSQAAARSPVTTPLEIITYYRLNHSFWSLSDNKESSR